MALKGRRAGKKLGVSVRPKPPSGPGDLAEVAPKEPPAPKRDPGSKPPAGPGTFPAPEPDEDGRSQADQ